MPARTAAEGLPHRSSRKEALAKGTAAGDFPAGPDYDPAKGLPKAVAGGTYKDDDSALPRAAPLPANNLPARNVRRGR